MSTFGGVAFTTLQGDRGRVLPDYEATVSERHIPGSNNNYIDLGGQLTPRVHIPIFVLNADLNAFKALIGIQRELDLGTHVYSAILTRLANQIELIDGTRYQFDADFLIVSGG